MKSLLEQARLSYRPKLPAILQEFQKLVPGRLVLSQSNINPCKPLFPASAALEPVVFKKGSRNKEARKLKIGVVFSGGQAAGGHNVISGLFDSLFGEHKESSLIGFLNGPDGLINCKYKRLDGPVIDSYRNLGGFDMIGSGRTKIETAEQFAKVRKTVLTQELDGLVIIGGDDSNTNAALLAEDFLVNGLKTVVVGIPKTIDGDLKNEWIETSFGFDTACKTYSDTIGSIIRDACSASKYYYFIKLMGRSASHVTLECALQTQPNLVFISEEVEAKKKTVSQITHEIADVICKRALLEKNYGVFLFPEGLIEFIPECKRLIKELNDLFAKGATPDFFSGSILEDSSKTLQIANQLSLEARDCYLSLPAVIQGQLLLDRDSHGNVQVSKIETERLFLDLVKKELQKRAQAGTYRGSFSGQPHFCGYEGRSCLPSNFDAHYCYALGHVAALLVGARLSGYMACIRGLAKPVSEWDIAAIPLVSMMNMEARKGKNLPVIKKATVSLEDPLFALFAKKRGEWILSDSYVFPGPIQFFGPSEIVDSISQTLQEESRARQPSLALKSY